jgi:hypothetical protein
LWQFRILARLNCNGGLEKWDGNNKKLTREFVGRFEGWEPTTSNEADFKPISKQERWALRELMTDPKYHTWYMGPEMTGPERRKLNHPNKIIETWKRKHPDPSKLKKVRKLSPALSPALQERDERIKELTEELEGALSTDLENLRSAYAFAFADKLKTAKNNAEMKRMAKAETKTLEVTVKEAISGKSADPLKEMERQINVAIV